MDTSHQSISSPTIKVPDVPLQRTSKPFYLSHVDRLPADCACSQDAYMEGLNYIHKSLVAPLIYWCARNHHMELGYKRKMPRMFNNLDVDLYMTYMHYKVRENNILVFEKAVVNEFRKRIQMFKPTVFTQALLGHFFQQQKNVIFLLKEEYNDLSTLLDDLKNEIPQLQWTFYHSFQTSRNFVDYMKHPNRIERVPNYTLIAKDALFERILANPVIQADAVRNELTSESFFMKKFSF
jgi:hypothetical protein